MTERMIFIAIWACILIMQITGTICLLYTKNAMGLFVFALGIIPSSLFLLAGILTKDEHF